MTTRLLVVPAVAFLFVAPALAGRPLSVDDADPVAPGLIEAEAGAGYTKEGGIKAWDMPVGLTYGVLEGLEAGIGFGGQYVEAGGEDESGIRDTAIGAKWQFLPSCPLGARHALAPSVKLPTADEDKGLGSGETDFDLTWIISRTLGEKAGAHVNLGYAWIGGPEDDVLHYGFALDYQATETMQAVGEVFAERETSGGADTVGQFNLGLRYSATDALALDLAAGSRIGDDGPDFTVTAGLTWVLE
ncbi:MAG TPA: transporter [Kiritimatiellia bacterium]|nr:transporter [Kiritimatiellia bacterium]HRZ13578.1 transporter [Kiritimatiellia bacterium]HSA19326.1 transporter [Kiritimatiellia bacterium]